MGEGADQGAQTLTVELMADEQWDRRIGRDREGRARPGAGSVRREPVDIGAVRNDRDALLGNAVMMGQFGHHAAGDGHLSAGAQMSQHQVVAGSDFEVHRVERPASGMTRAPGSSAGSSVSQRPNWCQRDGTTSVTSSEPSLANG